MDFPRFGHQAHQVLVDHEILPQAVPRLPVRLRQNGLDVVLALGH